VPRVDLELPGRILIVDDHLGARITIRGLLEWHSFEVVVTPRMAKKLSKKLLS
jgi:DNA-binding NarL/FixJ family response regulator